jgi:hypothetical protein
LLSSLEERSLEQIPISLHWSLHVMAGLSRPKDGVASLAYVPAIHALLCGQGVDARHKAGHDGG